jgi:type I restriction enzyme S subunit
VWTVESRERETIVNAGEILVGMDAEFRATAWLGQPGLLNQRVCRIRSSVFSAPFVREALKLPLAYLEKSKTATTVIHLNKKDLEEVTVPVFDPTRTRELEAIADPIFEKRVSMAAERRALAQLRSILLPQLMSGRLRAVDAEKLIEDAL